MANQTPEEKAAAEAAAAQKAAAEEQKILVKMTHKIHGELHIHPLCVSAHQAAGWKVA